MLVSSASRRTAISAALAAGVLAGSIGIGVVLTWPTAAVNALIGLTPTQVQAVAFESALSHGSVHITTTGPAATTLDVGANRGVQVISEAGHQLARITVVDGLAYLDGAETFLSQSVGLSPSIASSYANRWISFARSDGKLYEAVAGGVTLSSALDSLLPERVASLTAVQTVDGRSAVGVVGHFRVGGETPYTDTVTAYVSSSAPHDFIEVKAVATSAHATRYETVSFSDWGEPLLVRAPTGAVAYSSIPGH